MRGSKYNDYRVFYAVIAVIVLVVLGLLIYKNLNTHLEHEPLNDIWITVEEATCTADGQKCRVCSECGERFDYEPIPATGHTEASPVEENRVSSTCTKGGSYETVVYCRDCDYEFSRNTVQVEMLPHIPGEVKQEDIVNSTHTIAGSYNDVVRCTECDTILESEEKVIEPTGHDDHQWHVEYRPLFENDKQSQILLVGECTCGEVGNITILTADNEGVTVTKKDPTTAKCCENTYLVSYNYNGENIELDISLPLESHKLYAIEIQNPENPDEMIAAYVTVDNFATKDVNGNILYYDYSQPEIFEHVVFIKDTDWNNDGTRIGLIRCVACEAMRCQHEYDNNPIDGYLGDICCNEEGYSWHPIVIYSKEHDKTATPES